MLDFIDELQWECEMLDIFDIPFLMLGAINCWGQL